jgi:hypothetical protein
MAFPLEVIREDELVLGALIRDGGNAEVRFVTCRGRPGVLKVWSWLLTPARAAEHSRASRLSHPTRPTPFLSQALRQGICRLCGWPPRSTHVHGRGAMG